MSQHNTPRFGTREHGCNYVARPSAYAILRDSDSRLAVVRAPEGVFLPGGGLEAGESPEQAVVREVAEECGLVVDVLCCLGAAEDLLYAEREGVHYEIHSTFFEVRAVGSTPAVEPENVLGWRSTSAAVSELTRESQRWIVAETMA